MVNVQRRKKQLAVERFGGKCTNCGYDKCAAALEFHHLEDKENNPAYVIHRWSWDRAKIELDKCILLCANCHREVEYGCITPPTVVRKPFINKTCPCCKTVFDTKVEDQVYCNQTCYHMSARKITHPTKEQLQQLIDDDIPWTTLGKMFGVSDNAVRKWANKMDCKL